jgi:hypothetical protein
MQSSWGYDVVNLANILTATVRLSRGSLALMPDDHYPDILKNSPQKRCLYCIKSIPGWRLVPIMVDRFKVREAALQGNYSCLELGSCAPEDFQEF